MAVADISTFSGTAVFSRGAFVAAFPAVVGITAGIDAEFSPIIDAEGIRRRAFGEDTAFLQLFIERR